MYHPKLVQWERRLKKMFDRIDDYLEDTYGSRYPLHPNRPERGTTASKEHDGLFNVGATFSAGYGSKFGRGYVIEVDMVTLAHIPDRIEEEIMQEVLQMVDRLLAEHFPERELHVDRDRNALKIYGEFSLGSV
jgi:hypothetical protein